MNTRQEGKKEWLLNKEIRYRGQRMTKRQMVETLVKSGGKLRINHAYPVHTLH